MIGIIIMMRGQLKKITEKHWLKLLLISITKKNSYYKRAFKDTDEEGLKVYGKLFSLAPTLYYEGLKFNSDEELVLDIVKGILKEITIWKYKKVYLKNVDIKEFQTMHKKQNDSGFLKYNRWEEVTDTPSVHNLTIKNCYFYNAFKKYGVPKLTLAFCEADEDYFTTFSEKINFNRAQVEKNTIARGGDACLFNFESINK